MFDDNRPFTLNELARSAMSIYNARGGDKNASKGDRWMKIETFFSLLEPKNSVEGSRERPQAMATLARQAAYTRARIAGELTMDAVDENQQYVYRKQRGRRSVLKIPKIVRNGMINIFSNTDFITKYEDYIRRIVFSLCRDKSEAEKQEDKKQCEARLMSVLDGWDILWPILVGDEQGGPGGYVWQNDPEMTNKYHAKPVYDFIMAELATYIHSPDDKYRDGDLSAVGKSKNADDEFYQSLPMVMRDLSASPRDAMTVHQMDDDFEFESEEEMNKRLEKEAREIARKDWFIFDDKPRRGSR